MKWFVNYAFSYSPVNEKAKELGVWVDSFKHTLLTDDLSKDAFIEEARMVLVFLNKKYPKTKPIFLNCADIDRGGCFRLSFDLAKDTKTIAYMDIVKVLQEYRFRENGNALLPEEKGGQR
jgi:hypothetical protein